MTTNTQNRKSASVATAEKDDMARVITVTWDAQRKDAPRPCVHEAGLQENDMTDELTKYYTRLRYPDEDDWSLFLNDAETDQCICIYGDKEKGMVSELDSNVDDGSGVNLEIEMKMVPMSEVPKEYWSYETID